MRKVFWAIVVLSAVCAYFVLSPFRAFEPEAFVQIEHGNSSKAIGQKLADAGVIRHPWQFLLARALQPHVKLQAGEYRFSRAASVLEVFHRIARGDIYYFEFTVPEGSNIFDIAHSLEAQGILSASAFLEAAADTTAIQDLAPHAKSLEGYLFPSTYRMTHATTAAQLSKMMTSEFRTEWNRLSANVRSKPDVNAAVTLASLVEKETGTPEERRLIASVFVNRLAKNMRLQCDPTTIYAALLEDRYRGKIHQSDLARANPYNTYQHDGLPPGPIANPGIPSLNAALHPEPTDFLYFVAKPEGGAHKFSVTLEAHTKAVAQYRNAAAKRKAQ